MENAEKLITENLGVWTSAVKTKASAGRGSGKKRELHGIQKLRELILDLGISGNLLPQLDDEVVDQNSIAEAKKEFIRDRKIRRHPKTPDHLEELFTVPRNWVAYSLGELVWNCKSSYGSNPDPGLNTKGVVKVGNISNFSYFTGDFSPRGFEEGELEELLCEEGDLLVVKSSGSAENVHSGKIALCERQHHHQIVATNFVMRFRLFSDEILPRYAWYFLKSRHVRAWVKRSVQTMTYPNLKWTTYSEAFVAVPPLPEQHRIVAKVDELMVLCDQLEQAQSDSLETHETLVATLLDALIASASDAEHFQPAWQRIAEHFDALFTTEASIDQLKQTILQLAVMGKLVPQDSNDEPASELLKKIANEKARLVKEGKIKKQPKLPQVDESEFPFSPPSGWRFERIGNLTSKLGSGSTPRGGKSAYVPDGVIFLRSQNVWNDGLRLDDTAYIPDETHEAMNNTQVFPRDVLLNITGASLGRSTIFPESLVTANVSQHVTIIRLVEPAMAEFLHIGILSPLVQKLVWGRQVGMAIEGLSKKVLEKFEFPIPPLAEQHRIVAKVDELMALCDQLKASLANAQATQLNLADSLVEQAIA